MLFRRFPHDLADERTIVASWSETSLPLQIQVSSLHQFCQPPTCPILLIFSLISFNVLFFPSLLLGQKQLHNYKGYLLFSLFHFQLASVHCFWCRFLSSPDDGSDAVATFRNAVNQMEKVTMENIRLCGISRSKMNREIAKLFFLEYYKDLLTLEVKFSPVLNIKRLVLEVE